jgi:hypothetical protein
VLQRLEQQVALADLEIELVERVARLWVAWHVRAHALEA